jgi:hypothetical protein
MKAAVVLQFRNQIRRREIEKATGRDRQQRSRHHFRGSADLN